MKTIIRKLLWKAKQLRRPWTKAEIQGINNRAKGISLTKAEKKQIKELWGQIDEPYYKAVKALVPFGARYCSNQYYGHKILPVINPCHEILGIQDKNLYDSLYADDELKFPEVLARNIKGVLFDKDMRIIDEKQTIEKLLSVPEFIIKPSVESGGGKNVRKINNASVEIIENLFAEYKQNFIMQKTVEQHQLLAEFNKTSINTFRITTLFLNGKISICSRILRFGKEGQFVDNASSGGFYIGLDRHGNLGNIAYNKNLDKMKISKEIMLPFYPILENLAIAKHIKYFPHIGIIGWDLSIDLNCKPVCIEINSRFSGIFEWQFCNGPIFGERTEEVIEYVERHRIENFKAVV